MLLPRLLIRTRMMLTWQSSWPEALVVQYVVEACVFQTPWSFPCASQPNDRSPSTAVSDANQHGATSSLVQLLDPPHLGLDGALCTSTWHQAPRHSLYRRSTRYWTTRKLRLPQAHERHCCYCLGRWLWVRLRVWRRVRCRWWTVASSSNAAATRHSQHVHANHTGAPRTECHGFAATHITTSAQRRCCCYCGEPWDRQASAATTRIAHGANGLVTRDRSWFAQAQRGQRR